MAHLTARRANACGLEEHVLRKGQAKDHAVADYVRQGLLRTVSSLEGWGAVGEDKGDPRATERPRSAYRRDAAHGGVDGERCDFC